MIYLKRLKASFNIEEFKNYNFDLEINFIYHLWLLPIFIDSQIYSKPKFYH